MKEYLLLGLMCIGCITDALARGGGDAFIGGFGGSMAGSMIGSAMTSKSEPREKDDGGARQEVYRLERVMHKDINDMNDRLAAVEESVADIEETKKVVTALAVDVKAFKQEMQKQLDALAQKVAPATIEKPTMPPSTTVVQEQPKVVTEQPKQAETGPLAPPTQAPMKPAILAEPATEQSSEDMEKPEPATPMPADKPGERIVPQRLSANTNS